MSTYTGMTTTIFSTGAQRNQRAKLVRHNYRLLYVVGERGVVTVFMSSLFNDNF